MPLSPEEQQRLDELEASLAASDPRLAHVLRGHPTLVVDRRRALVAAVGAVAGLALLVAGLATHPVVSILGFGLMLVGTMAFLRAWHLEDSADEATDDAVAPRSDTGPTTVVVADQTSQRLNDRLSMWRRHVDVDED